MGSLYNRQVVFFVCILWIEREPGARCALFAQCRTPPGGTCITSVQQHAKARQDPERRTSVPGSCLSRQAALHNALTHKADIEPYIIDGKFLVSPFRCLPPPRSLSLRACRADDPRRLLGVLLGRSKQARAQQPPGWLSG
jgi:hypothetical protein